MIESDDPGMTLPIIVRKDAGALRVESRVPQQVDETPLEYPLPMVEDEEERVPPG